MWWAEMSCNYYPVQGISNWISFCRKLSLIVSSLWTISNFLKEKKKKRHTDSLKILPAYLHTI